MVREGSGDPHGGPGRVGRHTWRSVRGREANLEVREGSGGQPRGPGGVGRPNQRSKRGREANPEVRELHLKVKESS